jgi:hypothetical protein
MGQLVDKTRGALIQTGAEKEYNPTKLAGGTKLDPTRPKAFDPSLLGDLTQDMLKDGVAMKPAAQVAWDDLNDNGKVQWALRYKARHGDFPTIFANPGAEYSKISFEPNGWVEVISNPFDDVGKLGGFLQNFGWGHIHTSFMRSGNPEVVKQQVTWMRNANLWCFLNSLAERGGSGNGEAHWRFSIKGLSIPTEQHLELAAEIFNGKNMFATAFSKHLLMNARGAGEKGYGHRDRVGFETRGGTTEEKKRMIDSLLDGLVNGTWGTPAAGPDGLRMLRLAPDELRYDKKQKLLQVKTVPREVVTRIAEHTAKHPIDGVDPQRLYNFLAGATFYPGGAQKEARMTGFDQRVGVPLLNYEDLPWLDDAAKQRVVTARGHFIEKLAALEREGADPVARTLQICDLMKTWANEAQLHDAFGRWLDGPNGRQQFLS